MLLFVGSLSGGAISVCVQPLDVIRTRMQADATRNALSGAVGTLRKVVSEEGVRSDPLPCRILSAALSSPHNTSPTYVSSNVSCSFWIAAVLENRSENRLQVRRALWKGTGPTIVRLSVGLGLQMCVLESLKEAFRWRHVGSAEERKGKQKSPAIAVHLTHTKSTHSPAGPYVSQDNPPSHHV